MKGFKTKIDEVTEGKWFEAPYANNDGTTPAFKLRGFGDFNPAYSRAQAQKFKPFQKLINAGALPPAKREQAYKELLAEFGLADWRHVQPNDDGQELPFSEENAKSLIMDDAWRPLVSWLNEMAGDHSNYSDSNKEEAAKN